MNSQDEQQQQPQQEQPQEEEEQPLELNSTDDDGTDSYELIHERTRICRQLGINHN